MKRIFALATMAITLSLTAACSKEEDSAAQHSTAADPTASYIIHHLDELIGQRCSIDSTTHFLDFYYHFAPQFIYCTHQSQTDGLVDITAVQDATAKAAFYALRAKAHESGARDWVYETKDSAAFHQWVREQVQRSNWVISQYRKEAGLYAGTAFAPEKLPTNKTIVVRRDN